MARPDARRGAERLPGSAPVSDRPAASLRPWLLLYGLSGFVALSLEIAWFRLMDVAVKSTAYTFGTVLALYLLGLGLGSLVGGRRAARLERPLAAFLDLQLLLLASAGRRSRSSRGCRPRRRGTACSSSTGSTSRSSTSARTGRCRHSRGSTRLLPLTLFGLPTLLMGLSFGALQRAVQDDPATSGRKVGMLQAANILGCTAGSLVTGLLLLERVGTAGTLRLLRGARAAPCSCSSARAPWPDAGPRAAHGAASLSCFWPCPRTTVLWSRLHGIARATQTRASSARTRAP